MQPNPVFIMAQSENPDDIINLKDRNIYDDMSDFYADDQEFELVEVCISVTNI